MQRSSLTRLISFTLWCSPPQANRDSRWAKSRKAAASTGSFPRRNLSRRRKRTRIVRPKRPPSCANPSRSSSEHFDRVAAANHAALQDPAEHSPPSSQVAPQPRADSLHEVTRRTWSRHFHEGFSNPQPRAGLQAIHAQPLRSNILSDDARRETHCLQDLRFDKQHLSLASRPGVDATFKPRIFKRADLSNLLHRNVALWRAEEMLYRGHQTQSPTAIRRPAPVPMSLRKCIPSK